MEAIKAIYDTLQKASRQMTTAQYANTIAQLCQESLHLLQREGKVIPLVSLVPQKKYFAFRRTILIGKHSSVIRISRPINHALFISNHREFESLLSHFLDGEYRSLNETDTNRLLYTCAMSFCALRDIHEVGDKKTPATFFEFFISHLFARQFDVLPTKRLKVPAAGDKVVDLPTDTLFDLGPNRAKFHVPIKLSTRDRVIQAWAHQKVLEGIWGTGEYKGLLVVLTETKLNLKNLNVVEICLPQQWAIYQRYIAHLDRVYYLDVPLKYATLNNGSPRIEVKSLGSFFFEQAELLKR